MRQVYQGTQFIDKELLKAFVECKVSNIVKLNQAAEFTTEVSSTLLRIKSINLNTIDKDLTEYLNKFLLERIEDRYLDDASLDGFNVKIAKNENYTLKIVGGQPGYIAWCISTVDKFHVDIAWIDFLQTLTVYKFLGTRVERKTEDIYEYYANIEEYKHSFSNITLNKNRENHNADYNNDIYDDYVSDDYYDSRDPSESSCACGESPCMCSDSDPG